MDLKALNSVASGVAAHAPSLRPAGMEQAATRALTGAASAVGGATAAPAAEGDFSRVLSDMVRQVNGLQTESTRIQREFQLGSPEVSLEQSMIAMNKAQVGFQMLVQTRNRLINAYNEIMNMQV